MKGLLIAILIYASLGLYGQKVSFDTFPRSLEKQLRKMDCGRHATMIPFPMPEHIEEEDLTGRFYFVSGDQCSPEASYVFIGRVKTCASSGCLAHYKGSSEANFEFFDFYIIYDENGKVSLTRVYNYQATHGHEITSKSWLRQFREYDGMKDIRVGKDIDGITGATTSVLSISYEIQERTKRLNRALHFYITLFGATP